MKIWKYLPLLKNEAEGAEQSLIYQWTAMAHSLWAIDSNITTNKKIRITFLHRMSLR